MTEKFTCIGNLAALALLLPVQETISTTLDAHEHELVCEQIGQLESIDVLLFDSFPNIDAQALLPGNQIATELNPAQTSFKLK